MSFVLSIPLWGWVDIFSNIVVLLALCGESHWALKWLVPNKSVGKTSVKWRRDKLKKKFEFLLILGIAGEVSCLPLSLKEAAESNRDAGMAIERAAEVEKKTEELRKQNLELEATIQPRRISPEQKAQIKAFLGANQGSIEVNVDWWDPERILLANDVSNTLIGSGFNAPITGLSSIALGGPVRINFGILMQVRNLTNAPTFAAKIFNAFNKAGVPMGAEANDKLGTNDARIAVGNKPLR